MSYNPEHSPELRAIRADDKKPPMKTNKPTYAELLRFVKRLAKTQCEYYAVSGCIFHGDPSPCIPCQARQLLKGRKK